MLDMSPKVGGKFEHGMGCDMVRNIFMAFLLVADMDKSMINAHFKFCWRFIAAALVFIEFLETLECCK